MKSLLISYAGYPYSPSSLMPDNGLANLAGQLISEGHSAMILDYGTIDTMQRLFPRKISKRIENSMINRDFEELNRLNVILENDQKAELDRISIEIIRKIKQLKTDIIGFKLWWGDGFLGSLHIAEKIKEHDKDLLIVAGGPHVDYFRESIFKKSKVFDILVFGDGEYTILDIVDYTSGKKELRNIPNIIFLKDNKPVVNKLEWIKDLNTISEPVYDKKIYPSMQGDEKTKIVTIDESRGCPFKCAFCIQPVKSGRFLRIIKPKRVVEIMSNIKEKNKINRFRFAGSATPGRHIQAIGEEILKKELKIEYSSFARVNYANSKFFHLMKKSGLQALFFGVESGSQEILDKSINKDVKVKDMQRVLKECKNAGIFTIASIIMPAPFETEKTMQETFDFLMAVKPDSVPINPVGIFPHTEWFSNPKKFNIQLTSNNYLEELMVYRPLLLFPPDRWKTLPYIINGKDFKQLAKESSDFTIRLEQAGILTQVPDDMYMMASTGGYDPRYFRDMCRKYISIGDYKGMQKIVSRINRDITTENE